MFLNPQRRNLQGRSFRGENLSNTDFSYSNIQGADFTNANLTNANFSHAQAGLPLNWKIGILIIAALLSAMSGIAAVTTAYQTTLFLIPYPDKPISTTASLLCFFLTLAINIILLIITIRQGIQRTIAIVASVVAVCGSLIGVFSAISNDNNKFFDWFRAFRLGNFIAAANGQAGASSSAYVILYLAIAVAATIVVVVSLGLAVFLAVVVAGEGIKLLVVGEAMAIAIIATAIVTRNGSRYFDQIIPPLPKSVALAAQITVISIAVILAVALVLLNNYIADRVLAEDDKYIILHQIGVAIAVIGGTSFRGANLTNANFSYATLKSTDIRFANTTRTLWHKAINLDWARLSDTILMNSKVRDFLVSGNGREKSYTNANLKGANLMAADLSYANLREADLSEATFEDACLEWTNLSQVQAISTDFTNSKLTGACGLGTWNIDSTTQLEWVDCRWVYLLENPKPRTDDRERRPSSGEFAPGEFTSLFQEVLNTVDLIFRNGIDATAFTQSFQQVQVENEGIKLDIQSIENKGDGVVIVKVRVPVDANKAKIHSDFIQIYEDNLKALEQKYQAELKDRSALLERYHQQNADMLSVIKQIAEKPILSEKLVVINLVNGDFDRGFAAVTAQIWSDGHTLPTTFTASLPAKPEIPQLYQQWQVKYENLRLCYQAQGVLPRIKPQSQVKQVSIQDIPKLKKEIESLANELKKQLNTWLNSEEFSPIKNKLRTKLNISDPIRIIIQSEDIQVRRLPWHLWDLCEDYRQSEVALSATKGDRITKSLASRNKVRILAILGNSKGLNLEEDRQILENLPAAETVFLVEPTRKQFDEYLWDEQGWDILCFSGHSSSKWDKINGWIDINQTERLTIEQLENALKAAIERGLHLAIFNSCDGLGLAEQLDDLHIPQIIVMRESVPDLVAQEFLKNFLLTFSAGKSLYASVREARSKLQSMEDKFPCASWLPVICQNQAEIPRMWRSFVGGSHLNYKESLSQLQAVIEAKIT